MKKLNTRKLLAAVLAIVMILALSVPAFAANYDSTVSVISLHNDGSVNQVSFYTGQAGCSLNGYTVSGTFTISFPQGRQYGTPSADVCCQVLNGTYSGSSYYNGSTNYGTSYNGNGVIGSYDTFYSTPTTAGATSIMVYADSGYGHYVVGYDNSGRQSYVFVGAGHGDYEYNSYSGYGNNATYTYVGANANAHRDGTIDFYMYTYVGSNRGDFNYYAYEGFGYVGSGRGSYSRAAYDGNGNQVTSSSYYNGGTANNGNYYYNASTPSTAAQVEANQRYTNVQTRLDEYGIALSWKPSTTITATDTKAWYAISVVYPNGTFNKFSALTQKVNGWWSTTIASSWDNYGNPIGGGFTPDTFATAIVAYGSYGTLPCNVTRGSSAQLAGEAMLAYVRNQRQVTLDVQNSSYGQNAYNATVALKRGNQTVATIQILTELRSSDTYRSSFSMNGQPALLADILAI